jgi:hypothetical protein
MLTYSTSGRRLEVRAAGTIPQEESEAVMEAIRQDPAVPDQALFLLDVTDHDDSNVPLSEVGPRLFHMVGALGPKLGSFWAIVTANQLDQVVKLRLAQHLVRGSDITVTIFRDLDEARNWLDSLAQREPN